MNSSALNASSKKSTALRGLLRVAATFASTLFCLLATTPSSALEGRAATANPTASVRPSPNTQRPAAAGRSRTGKPDAKLGQLIKPTVKLPLRFEINEGQHDSHVDAVASRGGNRIALTGNTLVLDVAEAPIDRMRRAVAHQRHDKSGPMTPKEAARVDKEARRQLLSPHAWRKLRGEREQIDRVVLEAVGADPAAAASGELPLRTKSNYLRSDGTPLKTGIHNFAQIRYQDVYANIDKRYYGTADKVEFDWIVHAGADPSRIEQHVRGASAITSQPNGDLKLTTPHGAFTLKAPKVYQLVGSVRRPVAATYRVAGDFISFAIGDYDRSHDLVIDPVIDYIVSIPAEPGPVALGADGSIYFVNLASDAAGVDLSASPTSGTGIQLVKLDATATAVQYVTNIQGVDIDSLVVDATGAVFLGGHVFTGTSSTWLCDTAPRSGYLAKIAATGEEIAFSESFPNVNFGSFSSQPSSNCGVLSTSAVVLHPSGDVLYAASFDGVSPNGSAESVPTAASTLGATNQGPGFFVTRVAGDGSTLLWSLNYFPTAYQGPNYDDMADVYLAVDSTGSAYIAGNAGGGISLGLNTFPRVNAPVAADPPVSAGGRPNTITTAFVAKFNSTGTAIAYATPIYASSTADGSSNPLTGMMFSNVTGIAVDPSDNLVVAGSWVSKFDPNGNLLRSLFLDGITYIAEQAPFPPSFLQVDAAGGFVLGGMSYGLPAPFRIDPTAINASYQTTGAWPLCVIGACSVPNEIPYVRRIAPDWNSELWNMHFDAIDDEESAAAGRTMGDESNAQALFSLNLAADSSVIADVGGARGADLTPNAGAVVAPDIPNPACPCFVRITNALHFAATPNPAALGQLVDLRVTAPDTTWSGSVIFTTAAATLGATAMTSGVADLSTTALPQGTTTVTAAYSGDGSHGASTATVTVIVSAAPKNPTSIALSSSPRTPTEADSVTLSAAVTGVNGASLVGQVVLYSGFVQVASSPLAGGGSVTFPLGTLAPYNHYYTARYTGDPANADSSVTLYVYVVPGTPTISIGCPSSGVTMSVGSNGTYGASVSFSTATYLPFSGGAGTVSLTAGSLNFPSAIQQLVPIGKTYNPITGQFDAEGVYVVTATATTGDGRTATSNQCTVTVTSPGNPPPKSGDTTYFLHNDATGSPVAATDASGNVLWRENYSPFGQRQVNAASASPNVQWFQDKAADNSGLLYIGAREYDPWMGRFVERDALDLDEGNVHSLNPYGYANNNPNRFTDPDGRSPIDLLFLGYDLAQLGTAIAKGESVRSEVIATGLDLIGVVSPVPLVGEGLKAFTAVEHASEAVRAARDITAVAKESVDAGVTAAAKETNLVIGRLKDLEHLEPGEVSLVDRLPNLGSFKANWRQNASALREEMQRGRPIRDASINDKGGKYLNAERNLLKDRGWTSPDAPTNGTNYWLPPKP